MSDLEELRTYFYPDDGFLPEVSLVGYNHQEIVGIFNRMVEISDPSSLESELWHLPTESNVKLSHFTCAAETMLNGEAEAFHMMLKKTKFDGVTLPDLGAFIFRDEITLDYRRGSEWTEKVIKAFLRLIKTVMVTSPEIIIHHQECKELFNKHLTRL